MLCGRKIAARSLALLWPVAIALAGPATGLCSVLASAGQDDESHWQVDAEIDAALEELNLPAATWIDSKQGARSATVAGRMTGIDYFVPYFDAGSPFNQFRLTENASSRRSVKSNRSTPRGIVLNYADTHFYCVLPGIQPGEPDRVVAVPVTVAFASLFTISGFAIFLIAWRHYQRTFGRWP